MHARVRNLFTGCALLLPLAAALSPVLNAQTAPEDGPPNVLVIHREYLKPGKGGQLHERSESAFVHAFADAKSPYHYFALDSLSGPSRSLFLFGYNSFADWEKETAAIRSNPALGAKVDQASLNDGELLTGYDAGAIGRTMFDTSGSQDMTITVLLSQERVQLAPSQSLVRIVSKPDGRKYLGIVDAGPFAEPDSLRADSPILLAVATREANYLPRYHGIKLVPSSDQEFSVDAIAQFGEINANKASFLIAYVYKTFDNARKYGEAGLAFALIEVGAIATNIHLICTALGNGSCDVGSFSKRQLEKLLRVDGMSEHIVHLTVVGK